jgi:mono/diheme cytochrome c family protein
VTRLRATAGLAGALLAVLGAGAVAFAADTSGDGAALGKRLFTKEAAPPCALCHTLNEAGASGTIGPSLDELRPDAQRVAMAVRNGVGVMPAYTSLTDAQVQALARYVATAAGGK